MAKFYVGLDLGQASDYTALVILERITQAGNKEAVYHLRHMERVRGVPYPDVVKKVSEIIRAPALADDAKLIIDQTGCGRPVFDLFKAAKMRPIGVSITAGDIASHTGRAWRVPKRDLAGALQVLFQSGRLKIARKLPLADVLRAELENFKVKIDPKTAHDSYSAWREGEHDDLVLAVALAAWAAEVIPEPLNLIPNRTVSARRGVYPVEIC